MMRRLAASSAVDLSALLATPPALGAGVRAIDGSFAVVHVGGRQFKVTKNDTILTERVAAEVGAELLLRKVLLVATKDATLVGRPVLDQAAVAATVEEHARAEKVVIFKKKRRKGYQRTRGHRQGVSVLRIGDIIVDPKHHASDVLRHEDLSAGE